MRANPAQGCAGVGDDVDRRSVSTKGTYTRGHGEIVLRCRTLVRSNGLRLL